MTASTMQVLGALALELKPGSIPARDTLSQRDAGALSQLVANDLAAFAPEAAALELAMVGAHFDAVELLRPSWPLHREIDQLAARAPGASECRVIAFGAHDGQLPGSLSPSVDFAGRVALTPPASSQSWRKCSWLIVRYCFCFSGTAASASRNSSRRRLTR